MNYRENTHRNRLKKRFLLSKGQGFLEYELLELLLTYAIPRKDTKIMAKILLQRFKNLPKILNTPYDDLIKIEGIGNNTALLVSLVHICIHQSLKQEIIQKPVFSSWSKILDYCYVHYRNKDVELLTILLLNSRLELIDDVNILEGTTSEVYFSPRDIIKLLLDRYASGFIMVHNHPSGNAEPSKNDIESTKRLYLICSELNLHFHDHIIISEKNTISFKSRGLL